VIRRRGKVSASGWGLRAQAHKGDTFKARAAFTQEHGFEVTLGKFKIAASVYRVFRHADGLRVPRNRVRLVAGRA